MKLFPTPIPTWASDSLLGRILKQLICWIRLIWHLVTEWILSRDWECLLPFSAGEPITIPEPGAEMSLEVSVNKIKAIWQLCGNILREVLEKENLKSGKF